MRIKNQIGNVLIEAHRDCNTGSNKCKGISACLENSELLVMNLKNTRKIF